jgi:hypothetical protein
LNEFEHFYHDEIGQPPNKQGPIATNNKKFHNVFSNEIKIYQAIDVNQLIN